MSLLAASDSHTLHYVAKEVQVTERHDGTDCCGARVRGNRVSVTRALVSMPDSETRS